MNNELSLLVKDIPQDDVELFSKNTVATIDAKKVVDKITVDMLNLSYEYGQRLRTR